MAVIDKTAAPASHTTKIRGDGSRIALAEPVIGRRFAPTRGSLVRGDVSERNRGFVFSNTPSHSRGTMRPRLALISRPSQRGRRESRVRAAPAVSCAMEKEGRTRAYRSSGGIPAFPARWFTAYFVLSPVTGFLATVACE